MYPPFTFTRILSPSVRKVHFWPPLFLPHETIPRVPVWINLTQQLIYEIADLDKSDAPAAMSGFELMETGVSVTMREKSQAVILKYKA
jgi:hypothetical protein